MAERCVNRFTGCCQDEETKRVSLNDHQLRFSALLSRGYSTLQPCIYTIYCFLFHMSRHAAVSVRCRNTRTPALTLTLLDTQHVSYYQRQSYQHNGHESDTCQCSQYTCSWRGAHPYRQSIRHQLKALGAEPNTMQQITNVILRSSAIAIT